MVLIHRRGAEDAEMDVFLFAVERTANRNRSDVFIITWLMWIGINSFLIFWLQPMKFFFW